MGQGDGDGRMNGMEAEGRDQRSDVRGQGSGVRDERGEMRGDWWMTGRVGRN